MKKRVVLVAGVIMTAFCACASQKDQMDSSNKNNSVEVTEKVNSDPKHTEKKKYAFTSSEEIENIDDDDLVYILENDYSTEDFFEEGSYHSIDLFDIEMQIPTKENPDAAFEYVMINVLDIEELEGKADLTEVLPIGIMKEYAEKDCDEFVNIQNTKEPGEETGILVKDKRIIFCGETENYVEYSARYTDSRSLYRDDILVTYNIPRAYRRVYMRSLLMTAEGNSRQLLMLGKLSKEYVEEQLDIYLRNNLVLYREVSELENCFVYTQYYAGMIYGDFGIDNEACLYKKMITVDKESRKVHYGSREQIKKVIISGSAEEWPTEEW